MSRLKDQLATVMRLLVNAAVVEISKLLDECTSQNVYTESQRQSTGPGTEVSWSQAEFTFA